MIFSKEGMGKPVGEQRNLRRDGRYRGEGPPRVGLPSGEGGMDFDVRVVP